MKDQFKGTTITELIVLMALILIIFGFLSVNLVGTIRRPASAASVDVFLADLRSQQIKAMETGVSQSVAISATGYRLSPDNFLVSLPEGFAFLEQQTILFNFETGEMTPTIVTLSDTQIDNDTVIQLNRYGARY